MIIYLVLWVIFCARWSVEVALIGVVLSGIVYRFGCRYLGYDPGQEYRLLKKGGALLQYAGIVVWETILSNIQVSKIVFARKIEVEPRIIFFTTELKTDAARVMLANSITLTPGTITVALQDGLFCVHCLNSEMAEGIERSVFVRKLREIEE